MGFSRSQNVEFCVSKCVLWATKTDFLRTWCHQNMSSSDVIFVIFGSKPVQNSTWFCLEIWKNQSCFLDRTFGHISCHFWKTSEPLFAVQNPQKRHRFGSSWIIETARKYRFVSEKLFQNVAIGLRHWVQKVCTLPTQNSLKTCFCHLKCPGTDIELQDLAGVLPHDDVIKMIDKNLTF